MEAVVASAVLPQMGRSDRNQAPRVLGAAPARAGRPRCLLVPPNGRKDQGLERRMLSGLMHFAWVISDEQNHQDPSRD